MAERANGGTGRRVSLGKLRQREATKITCLSNERQYVQIVKRRTRLVSSRAARHSARRTPAGLVRERKPGRANDVRR
jgi:hypothetical protein